MRARIAGVLVAALLLVPAVAFSQAPPDQTVVGLVRSEVSRGGTIEALESELVQAGCTPITLWANPGTPEAGRTSSARSRR